MSESICGQRVTCAMSCAVLAPLKWPARRSLCASAKIPATVASSGRLSRINTAPSRWPDSPASVAERSLISSGGVGTGSFGCGSGRCSSASAATDSDAACLLVGAGVAWSWMRTCLQLTIVSSGAGAGLVFAEAKESSAVTRRLKQSAVVFFEPGRYTMVYSKSLNATLHR